MLWVILANVTAVAALLISQTVSETVIWHQLQHVTLYTHVISCHIHTAVTRVKNLAVASSLAERQSAILYISGDSTSHARWPGVEPQLRSKFQLSHIILHLPSHWSNMLPIHYTINKVS